MCKYEEYRQELIRAIVNKEEDAFSLADYLIELCEKIDKQDEIINKLLGGIVNERDILGYWFNRKTRRYCK